MIARLAVLGGRQPGSHSAPGHGRAATTRDRDRGARRDDRRRSHTARGPSRGERTLFNWAGCTVGGSGQDAPRRALAASRLRRAQHLDPRTIHAASVEANPLVLSLIGKVSPRPGPEGKSSIAHAVAVALLTGRDGERQSTDAAVNDPAVSAGRPTITMHTDAAIPTDAATVTVTGDDGRTSRRTGRRR